MADNWNSEAKLQVKREYCMEQKMRSLVQHERVEM